MKKKALTTVALGAATLAAGMAGNVHADSVKVTKQQIGDETKITTTTTKDVNQQKIAQDKQNISSQQTVVSSAKSSLDKAKANASSASQVVSSAQSKVNDAKKALDVAKASQPDQIKHQVATDQSQVNTDKQNISSTQSSITTDKSNVAKDQQAINNVGQKAQQDQNKLNNDQSELNNANKEVQQTQSVINNDQSKVNKINDILNDTADIKVPDKFKDGSKVSDDDIPGFYTWANSQMPRHTSDDNEKIDPRNLTPDQLKEINIFVVNVINEVAKQVGGGNHILNQNMIDMAQEIISLINKTHFDQEDNGHDDYAINQAAKDHGLKYDSKYLTSEAQNAKAFSDKGIDGNPYEDWSGMFTDPCWISPNESTDEYYYDPDSPNAKYKGTMYGLKIVTLDALLKMMSDPDHFNGTFMGDNVYTGIGINTTDGPEKDDAGLHIETTPISNVTNKNLFSGKDIIVDVNTLQKEKDNLEQDILNQKKKLNKENRTVNTLQNQANADKAQLQKDTPAGLQQQLQNDQKKLADDQATLQKQQQKLAQDEAQLKADQKKLSSITPEDITNAQKALNQAQTNYNNAVKALNDAQTKANASNDELAKAQQNYINALNKLNELKQILENDEKQITTTSVQWIKNQHPTTTSSMGNKVVLHSSSKMNASSVVSNEKEANTVHADTVSAVKLAQSDAIHFASETSASAKKAAKKNALPQMGDENSNKTVWGEISLAMAGVLATLGLVDRKRRN